VRSPRLLPARSSVHSIYFLRRTLSVVALAGIDAGALAISVVAASYAGHGTLAEPWPGLTWSGVAVLLCVLVTVTALSGLYGRRLTRHRPGRLFSAWVVAFVISSVLMLAVNPDGLGARIVAVWLTAFALSFAGRWAFDALLVLRYGAEAELPRVVVIGDPAACENALIALSAQPPRSRVTVAGFVAVPDTGADRAVTPNGAQLPPRYENLELALRGAKASEVVIADPGAVNGHLRSIMEDCRRHGVALKAVVSSLPLCREKVSYVPGLDCPLYLVLPKPAGWSSYLVKRGADRAGAVFLLVVLSPLLLAIAVAIRLTSPGPVLFADKRVGIGQLPFTCYKFRTMVADAPDLQRDLEDRNEAQGVLFKIREDPRVTSIGRVLRRYSLDELPQLLNVLKGDMGFVGPRPLPLRDSRLMEEWHRQRHVVLPGMTGLWQISGRSDIGFDEMLELDLRYIETWSLRGDLQIIWRTASAVLGSRGAY
jgi:exopolysaccharide biosynthesis polyprenyl glycosylphosphotransferase